MAPSVAKNGKLGKTERSRNFHRPTAAADPEGRSMITKFTTVYAGHVDLPDRGQDTTPANERRYSNQHLASVFEKTEAIAKKMDALGYETLWLAEHHFQHEGYECIPNILMLAVHLAHVTKRLKVGCGFNIVPMWHPLRLAEDFATADILTSGRVVFGVGRGYHTREVESFGGPMLDGEANREVFEEGVEIIFKAFNQESFSHKGAHYTLPPRVPYRGYELKELTLVPRPIHRPVECWQPVVSASPRGLDFMVKHGIKGAVGGGAATMQAGPITAYRDAAARAGKELKLGEDLQLGLHFHLARSREQAVREIKPIYEEHVKMFAPLGFVPGLTPAQAGAVAHRGGWDAAGVPTVEHYMKLGSWFAGTPAELIELLKGIEERYPGMQHISLSSPIGTPQATMLEQFQWVAEEVMPAFRTSQN
jgi:alkanesulfonate monooxygenase SsuD/methylene tetrahydromethanopterin reductase-like flavin-dependent oxidoreductase (luciferase family)